MEQTIKKATNLEELYQTFDNQESLKKEQKEFYVEIYSDSINKLKSSIKFNQNPSKKFYVTGQSGNGKTTALNFLVDEKIEAKYSVKYIRGRDLFLLNDVDIVDILLMTGYELIKEEEDLRDTFFNYLEKIRKTKLDSYQEINETEAKKGKSGEIKANSSIKTSLLSMINFSMEMFGKYKIDNTYKQTVREMFTLNKMELVNEINKIIEKYKEKYNKNLLLIFDDLEKMKKHEQIEELFIDNNEFFDKLTCVKILTIPVYLTTKYSMFNSDVFKFSIRIDKSPLDNIEDEKPENNREKLRELILKRVDESKNLIESRVIEEVINNSGGNLRLLIQIIQKATISALSLDEEATIVTMEHLKDGLTDIRNSFATAIMDRVEVLDYISKKHIVIDSEIKDFSHLRDSLLDNMVFVYFNGNPWYGVNPIIKDTVKKYISQIDKKDN